MVFGRLRATETYCREKIDPIALSGVFDLVADCEICEMVNGCSVTDGQIEPYSQNHQGSWHAVGLFANAAIHASEEVAEGAFRQRDLEKQITEANCNHDLFLRRPLFRNMGQ